MNLIMVECPKCKGHFLTDVKTGVITCPLCGFVDNIYEGD